MSTFDLVYLEVKKNQGFVITPVSVSVPSSSKPFSQKTYYGSNRQAFRPTDRAHFHSDYYLADY